MQEELRRDHRAGPDAEQALSPQRTGSRWSEGQRHLAEPPASPTPSPQLLPGKEEVLTTAVGERALNERRRTLDAPLLVPKDTVPRIVASTHEEEDLTRP